MGPNRRAQERERAARRWLAFAIKGLAISFYWTVTAIAMVVVGIVRYFVGWITDIWALVGIWFLAALIWFAGWGLRKSVVP
jgi:hypothetical protein